MDFKIGDEVGNANPKTRRANDKMMWVIVITISLVCGLTVFFITDALFKGEEEVEVPPAVEETLAVTDTNVQILYKYVTYGTRNKRNEKFLKESNVTLDSFNNKERFYYALQFVQKGDLRATSDTNSKKEIIYNISEAKIREYMQRFFGEKVAYSSKIAFNYPFNFTINGKNVGTISTATEDGYDIVFSSYEANIPAEIVEPFYTKLVAAYKEPDSTYRLEEKVIYTRYEKNNDVYNIYIYQDYNQTKLISTVLDKTEAELKTTPISVDDYLEKAATVTYHFGLNGTTLYFESSKITTE